MACAGPGLQAQLSNPVIEYVMSKTNACRILDSLGITYELREYEVDPDDLSAENVAAKVGFPPAQVFKTLAVQGDRHGVAVAVIPGNYELDCKALAHAPATAASRCFPSNKCRVSPAIFAVVSPLSE